MDFGLARPTRVSPVAGALSESPTGSRPITTEGTIVGAFQYMAPEQLEGKEADARVDLWALGCVLHEMATGKRAFEGTSQASLIAAILKEQPRPISELQPLSPPALERIVKKCLEKDPDERLQSSRDLVFNLEGISIPGTASASILAGGARVGRRPSWMTFVALGIVATLLAAGARSREVFWLVRRCPRCAGWPRSAPLRESSDGYPRQAISARQGEGARLA